MIKGVLALTNISRTKYLLHLLFICVLFQICTTSISRCSHNCTCVHLQEYGTKKCLEKCTRVHFIYSLFFMENMYMCYHLQGYGTKKLFRKRRKIESNPNPIRWNSLILSFYFLCFHNSDFMSVKSNKRFLILKIENNLNQTLKDKKRSHGKSIL